VYGHKVKYTRPHKQYLQALNSYSVLQILAWSHLVLMKDAVSHKITQHYTV